MSAVARTLAAVVFLISASSATGQSETAGYAGGNGGSPFPSDNAEGLTVAAISVGHGAYVDSLQIDYKDGDGHAYLGTRYGGGGGVVDIFTLSDGEYIVAIEGSAGLLVDSIWFVTNTGRRSPAYGGCGGNPYRLQAPVGSEIVGFAGRSGTFIEQISIAYRSRISSKPEAPPAVAAPAAVTSKEINAVLQAGFAGGAGGTPFPADSIAPNLAVSAVYVRHGAWVDSIQVGYKDAESRFYLGTKHGGAGGSQDIFPLADGECIVAIEGQAGERVDSISFITNMGRKSPRYGATNSKPFLLQVPGGSEIIGFYGRSGWFLDRIGIVYRRRAASRPGL